MYAEDYEKPLEGEQWIETPGKSAAAVSSMGRLRTREGAITQGGIRGGYRVFGGHPVHRLVALAFLPPIEGKEIVNHKDNDPLNNDVGNLEWVTSQENTQHAVRMGVMGKGGAKGLPVRQFVPEGKEEIVYESIAEASRQTGVAKGNIWSVCDGRRKLAGGYAWEFVNADESSPDAGGCSSAMGEYRPDEAVRTSTPDTEGTVADDDPIWAELGL